VAKHFMVPYNKKLWTVHPKEMTLSWMGSYVPQPDLEAALDGALREPTKSIGYNASFFYPKEGGIEALPNIFLPHIQNLHLESKVQSIDVKRKTVLIHGQEHHYSALISTIPLRQLLSLIKDVDPKIRELSKLLRHNSVCTVNIGIKREKISDYHWLYFPEEKYIFYRVGFPSQLSPKMAPPGQSSLNVEISYAPDKPIDEKTVLHRVIHDLKMAKILHDSDEILTSKTINIPCAYVIYDKKREEVLPIIQDYLRKNDIVSTGRYGSWNYSAMEDAMFDGVKAAKAVSAQRFPQRKLASA